MRSPTNRLRVGRAGHAAEMVGNSFVSRDDQPILRPCGNLRTCRGPKLPSRNSKRQVPAKSEVLEQDQHPIVRWWEQTGDVLHKAILRLYWALGEVRPRSPKESLMLVTPHVRRELIDLAPHYGSPKGLDAITPLSRPRRHDA